MTDRPIIFSTPMVLALKEGRKRMTRRMAITVTKQGRKRASPWCRVAIGDRLYVRESAHIDGREVNYMADHPGDPSGLGWRPSIHLPRWASRLTLTVTAIKIEAIKDISEADAQAEGAMFHDGRGIGHSGWRHDYRDVYPTARSSFVALWSKLHGTQAWTDNPDVVAISFDVAKRNIDAL